MKNKRIVIKVGTNVLMSNGDKLKKDNLINIVNQVAWLKEQGWQAILVTSGAVAAGQDGIDLKGIKEVGVKRQVYAAIGQVSLMEYYRELFEKFNITIAQALLIRDDFVNRSRYLNVHQTLEHLLNQNVVTIINENDVITTHESTFGDNDSLAANTAISISADYLILLTNIDGLYDSDPAENKQAQLISEVKEFDSKLMDMCFTQKDSSGMGGMISKLQAAKLATSAGIQTIVANGLDKDIIKNIINGKKIGTKFLAKKLDINSKERWFLSGKNLGSALVIDDGAVNALLNRKSLLMVGVKSLKGSFKVDEVIEILNQNNKTIGYGRINFDSIELKNAFKNPKSLPREIIHADNLLII
ncbi:MAG: glutamate 5-kinase [Candidatus Kerfeldbacteria bacterium]|jgi:glutamate 5-kinase